MSSARRAVVAASILAVAGAVAGGIAMVGSPTEARARRLDALRISDVQGIQRGVGMFVTSEKRLPTSLDELAVREGVRITDPETGSQYEYRATDGRSYDVCVVFARVSEASAPAYDRPWEHGAGRHCYQLTTEKSDR